MPASVIFFCGNGDAPQLHVAVLFDAYLEQLVGKIAVLRKLVKDQCEKLPLEAEIQTGRSVNAHKACMQAHTRVFSGGARFVCWAAKVDTVIRNEGPVSFENDSFEFPVLSSGLSEVIHMRAKKAPSLGGGCQRRAQVFINQYFLQTPSPLGRSREVASWKQRR
jgi:hypothetical protein